MLDILKADPAKLEAYKDVRRARLEDDPQGIEKALSDPEMRRVAAVKSGKPLTLKVDESADNVFGFARNMLFGPLTRSGYRFRVLGRFTRAGTNEAMKRLLHEPNLLAEALRLRNASVKNAKYWHLLGVLGISAGDVVMGN